MQQNMNLIICDHLEKKYITGNQTLMALNGVSLEIARGEYIAISGKSGSGKSTLMNMIGLIDQPSAGKVFLDENDLSKCSEQQKSMLRNQMIGYVFQSFYLEPSYTTYKNVEMPLLISGVPKKQRRERVLASLEMVGLSSKVKNRADTLSGGEKQRACIARALVNQPELILADEPCGNLDSYNASEVMRLFDKLHESGKTIVLITHNEEDAKRAQRQIFMKDGKIVS